MFHKIEISTCSSDLEVVKTHLEEKTKIEFGGLDKFNIIISTPDNSCVPILSEEDSDGYDLSIKENHVINEFNEKIGLGVKIKLPKGLKINLLSKSSTFDKISGLLANSVGTIDSSYRGELIASVLFFDILTKNKSIIINKQNDGKRINYFQMSFNSSMTHINKAYSEPLKILVIVNQTIFDNFHLLFPTKRSVGGFGSTDNK